MSSLRGRLLVSVIAAVGIVWLGTAAWFALEVRAEARDFLDARLVESARMVRGLLSRGEVRPGKDAPARIQRPSDGKDMPSTLACQIWSAHGQLLAVSAGAPEAELASMASGFGVRTIKGQEWRVYALPFPEHGVRILVGERRDLRRALVGDIAAGMLLPFVVLAPLLAGLLWYGIRRGLKPLDRLGKTIEHRDPGSLTRISDESVPREARPLVASINRLFERLSQAFERERRFTSDAAHELRTPLAAVKTHVQVARSTDEPASRDRALGFLETAVDRSVHLVDALLLLARLDAGGRTSEGRAHPGTVVRAALQECEPLALARGVAMSADVQERLPAVPIPEPALMAAVRNLLQNACCHLRSHGQVWIRLYEKDGAVTFEVQDDGPGIPEEELAKVRERFFRGSNAQGHGSGLGLSIVDQIAARYGCSFRLENVPDGGLKASISLPATSDARA